MCIVVCTTTSEYYVIVIIKRNFIYLYKTSFCTIYKAMVRSELEYAVSVWNPYRKEDILRIQKVLMRATKIVSSAKLLPYKDRLKRLKFKHSNLYEIEEI